MRLAVLDRALALPNADGPRSIEAVRVLRISLTDRCNYRCLYCMPEEGVRWLPREQILSRREIVQVARAALEVHGISRFKLTGGEPTVRPDLIELVAELAELEGIDDLSMTTNGQLLANLAEPLRQAGLKRVTVSIDSLRPARFRQITRTGDLSAVLRGLDAAERAGLESIKINCVTMRGVNDDEFADFARLTLDRRVTVRFIEYMPLGEAALMDESGPASGCGAQDRGADSLVPEEEVRTTIESAMSPLIPIRRDLEAGVGPANVYRLAEARGRIGFISSMSAPFCATCNRLRLTADGLLRSCLFDGGEVDVKPILRGQTPDRQRDLAQAMVDCVRLKPVVHSHHGNQQMSRIGG
jgi:GTP 3',8-cyclase